MVKETNSSNKTPKLNRTPEQHKIDQELRVTESNQIAASNVDPLTINIDKSHHFIKNIYKEIADNIFDGLMCIDPTFVILFANKTIHEMAGIESPQLIGRNIFEFIPIDQHPILFEQINLRNQGIAGFYQLNLEVLGKKSRVDIRAKPMFNALGKYEYSIVILTDITERVQLKVQLEESESKLRHIFENINEGFIITNDTNQVIMANHAAARIFGLQTGTIEGMNLYEMIDKSRMKIITFEHSSYQATGNNKYEIELILPNGSTIHILFSVSSQYDSQGNYTGAYGVVTDISDSIETQKALLKSEEKFRTLIERMSEGIVITDANDKIIYCNDQVCSLLKSSLRDLINKSVFDLNIIEADKETLKDHALKVKEGLVSKIELQIVNKNGEQLYFVITSQPTLKKGIFAGAISIISDVTELKLIQFEQIEVIGKLQTTLEDVKTLTGLLPICSYCKKIRNDEGYWLQLEEYLSKHSEAKFTHSICNECLKKMP